MPDNMTLEWIVESKLGANPELLAQAVRRLPKIQGFTYAWVACEFEAMKLTPAIFTRRAAFRKRAALYF